MGQSFAAVTEDEFSRIGGERPTFLIIEEFLVKMGGGGKDGVNFKYELLKSAGWKYEPLTSYGKNPELAATAFNKIGGLLAETDVKDELVSRLQADG